MCTCTARSGLVVRPSHRMLHVYEMTRGRAELERESHIAESVHSRSLNPLVHGGGVSGVCRCMRTCVIMRVSIYVVNRLRSQAHEISGHVRSVPQDLRTIGLRRSDRVMIIDPTVRDVARLSHVIACLFPRVMAVNCIQGTRGTGKILSQGINLAVGSLASGMREIAGMALVIRAFHGVSRCLPRLDIPFFLYGTQGKESVSLALNRRASRGCRATARNTISRCSCSLNFNCRRNKGI